MAKNRLTPSKEVNKIVKLAKQQGWRVEKAKSSHILLYPPNVKDGFVTLPSSPSSDRNFKNMLSMLKAKGLVL